MGLDVSLSEVSSVAAGMTEDLSVNGSEFGPLVIRAIRIEGVLSHSVLKSESLPWLDKVVVRINVSGDIGFNANLFRNGGKGGIGVGIQAIIGTSYLQYAPCGAGA